jgi:hypothetical protein
MNSVARLGEGLPFGRFFLLERNFLLRKIGPNPTMYASDLGTLCLKIPNILINNLLISLFTYFVRLHFGQFLDKIGRFFVETSGHTVDDINSCSS